MNHFCHMLAFPHLGLAADRHTYTPGAFLGNGFLSSGITVEAY